MVETITTIAVSTAGSDSLEGVIEKARKSRDTNFEFCGKPFWVFRGEDRREIYVMFSDRIEDFSTQLSKVYLKVPGVSKQEIDSYSNSDTVNGNELLGGIKQLIEDYVLLEDERQYDFLAMWIIHLYIYNSFKTTPYLILSGAPGTGKSTLLELCCKLSPAGNQVLGQPSVPIAFRRTHLERQSLFIDEYENLSKEVITSINSIFNTGYTYGKKVPRMNKDNLDEINYFDVFCPKAVTVNDDSKLPQTLRDRSIQIRMFHKKGMNKKIEFIDKDEELIRNTRAKIYRFLRQNYSSVMESFGKFSRDGWFPREQQIAAPLVSLSRVFNCEDRVISWLEEFFTSEKDNAQFKQEFILLKNLYENLSETETKKYRVQDIVKLCNWEYAQITPESIGRMISRLKLDVNKTRNNGVIYGISKREVVESIRREGYDRLMPLLKSPSELAEPTTKGGD